MTRITEMTFRDTPRPPRRFALDEIGVIRPGFTQREASKPQFADRYWRSLHARDVSEDGSVVWGELSHLAAPTDLDRYEVHAGDVLIPLRSARVQAVSWPSIPAGVVAVGHWAVLAPNPDLTTPDYLVVYLNQRTARARLSALQRGASIRFLSMKDLREFQVDIPPFPVQDQIVRLHALQVRVTRLERELAQARAMLVEAAIQVAVHPPVTSRTA
ncbi:MAG: restriction endonuclease subunit S domain-containing protein [Longimicrobiales bacterium]